MTRSTFGWTLLILSGIAVALTGQTCGVTQNGGNNNQNDDDALAPLVPGDDPLAPLVPTRGACGYWSGTLTGTRKQVDTEHTECPWSDGDIDIEDTTNEDEHKLNVTMTFPDVWGANPYGTTCAPTGTSQKAVQADGSIEFTHSFTYDHDWGDGCKFHHSTEDDTFVFSVKADNITADIEVYPRPYTYTEQQNILAERPCRSEYPIRVQLRISSVGASGVGMHHWTDRSMGCPAGSTTPEALDTNGSEEMDSNAAASVTAILYGTYTIDASGRDTIMASYKGSSQANPNPDGRCNGVNENCSSNCSDLLSEDYTLTLTRTPDGDRDMDSECDSLDPCPDDAFENECE